MKVILLAVRKKSMFFLSTALLALLHSISTAQETGARIGSNQSVQTAAADNELWRRIEEAAVLAGGLGLHLNQAVVRVGKPLVISIDVPRQGYLNVITVGPDGEATVLFPNRFHSSNVVPIGKLTIPTPSMNFQIKAKRPYGRTLVAAFLSQEPTDFLALRGKNGNGQGNLQNQFTQLSESAQVLLDKLSMKNLGVAPRNALLLAGKAEVLICAESSACGDDDFASAGTRLSESVPSLPDALVPGILLESEDKATVSKTVQLRSVYEKGIRLTKASEGFVPRLYNDAAQYCTIAYGHLVKRQRCDGTESKRFLKGISEPEGGILLVSDMAKAQRAVMSLVKTELTDGQYAALCDFSYNVGAGNLKKSTLLKAVNAREFHRVPFQLRRWIKANGKPYGGLKTRREREIALFFEGQAVPKQAPKRENLSSLDIRKGE